MTKASKIVERGTHAAFYIRISLFVCFQYANAKSVTRQIGQPCEILCPGNDKRIQTVGAGDCGKQD